MEGDEDWVSTSPIKLHIPPARRAFTPGRVLSRDEIRQQRRRGLDHAQPRVDSAQSSLKRRLFPDHPAADGDLSAEKPARQYTSNQVSLVKTVEVSRSTAASSTSTLLKSPPAKTGVDAGLIRNTEQNDRVSNDESIKLAGPSGSVNPAKQNRYRNVVLPPMPTPAKAIAGFGSSDYLSEDDGEEDFDSSLKVDARLEIDDRIRQSSLSPHGETPELPRQLFNPSPSPSVSSPSPPRKRPREIEEDADSSDAGENNATYESRLHPPSDHTLKKAKGDTSVHGMQDADDYQNQSLNDTESLGHEVLSSRSPETDSKLQRAASYRPPSPKHRKQRQVVDSLKGLLDRTWPAVQKSLQDFRILSRSKKTIDKEACESLEASLHRHLRDRLAKLEELQSLQTKRHQESERTRKIQAERTFLATRMREEERQWQKSRMNFRVNIGLHEAAVRSAAGLP